MWVQVVCVQSPLAGPVPRRTSAEGFGAETPPALPAVSEPAPPAGSMCHINIDECADSPCHNGGTCEDGINGFTCRCPEGYHDPTCLSEVNECNSNPCIHGACRDSLNGCAQAPGGSCGG